MVNPEQFYTSDETPDEKHRQQLWRSIEPSLRQPRARLWIVNDRSSFLYGMAASIILGLALFGAWTLASRAIENAEPQPLRVEQAYVSAISEFERVIPSTPAQGASYQRGAGQFRDRQEQLKLINAAIADLRKETNGRDLSPLKRERLRGLYSQELKILQQMIEQGEIEL